MLEIHVKCFFITNVNEQCTTRHFFNEIVSQASKLTYVQHSLKDQ